MGTAQNPVCEHSLYLFSPALCSGPGTEQKQCIQSCENGSVSVWTALPGRITLHQGREVGITHGPVWSLVLQVPRQQVVESGG